jgi:hypothetical protein
MKKNIPLKAIDTIELEFKNKTEFLEWRKKILENYEQSKIDYKEEMNKLFGYEKEQD